MRIMIISSDTKSLIDFRMDLMIKIRDKGHEIIAVAPEKKFIEDFNKNGINFIQIKFDRVSTSILDDINFYFKIKSLIRSEKPDMVFSYALKPVIYGSLAAKRCGVKKIYSLLPGLGHAFNKDIINLKDKSINRIVKILLKKSLKYNTRVIVQNPDDKQELLNEKIIDEARIVRVNSSGVNMEKFKVTKYPEKITFIMVSRLLKNKGVLEYIEAARQIKNENSNVRFLLLGPIDSNPLSLKRDELNNLIEDGCIEYLGEVNDVREYIGQSSVFILPSYYREGVPRSIQEAMSMGRAIITTDWIGCRETVIDGYNGYLVKVRDVKDLKKSIKKFINSPELIQKMGKNSIKYCKEKFEKDIVNEQMCSSMDIN